uniref:Citropin-1.1 n=1 Tax=Ranoidea citropa TaxID=94770 RepID=CT11_RANCI|nr:RecName: Full=Citropin-1.1; Contains: RecName: Full=Citropin-1.1.1; Contains: RecName: Full=Citropin-1.1.2 [Ranoidea citropa]
GLFDVIKKVASVIGGL